MKKLRLIIYAVALLAATSTTAQYRTITNAFLGGGATIAASSTNTFTNYMAVWRTRYVAAEVYFRATNNAITNDLVSIFEKSHDNALWTTAIVWTNHYEGTNLVHNNTNYDLGVYGYFRLRTNINYGSTALTNAYILGAYKPGVALDAFDVLGYVPQPGSANLTNWSGRQTNQFQLANDSLVQFTTEATSHEAGVLYTNLTERRGWLIGAVVGGGATLLAYTNNGVPYSLNLTNASTFCVPMSTNATFMFYTNDPATYLTNAVFWK